MKAGHRADAVGTVVQANVWTGESSSKPVKSYNAVGADEMMLSLWGILTFCLFVQTLRINRGLQTLFISLTILFFLLAGGVKNELCNKARTHPAPTQPPPLQACVLCYACWLPC